MVFGAGATNALTAGNDTKTHSLIALGATRHGTPLMEFQDASTVSMAWAGLNIGPMKGKFGMVVGLIVITCIKYISRTPRIKG